MTVLYLLSFSKYNTSIYLHKIIWCSYFWLLILMCNVINWAMSCSIFFVKIIQSLHLFWLKFLKVVMNVYWMIIYSLPPLLLSFFSLYSSGSTPLPWFFSTLTFWHNAYLQGVRTSNFFKLLLRCIHFQVY